MNEYWKKLAAYFDTGTLSYKMYSELSEDLKRRYRKLWRGKSGHLNGRPLSPEEKKALKKQAKFRRKKNKAEKQARKLNHK
jgi:hypothetical protein